MDESLSIAQSCKMRASILKQVSLGLISNCEVDSVAALSAFAQASGFYWADPGALRWLLYEAFLAMNVVVLEEEVDGCKEGSCSYGILGRVHLKVVP